MIFWWMSDKNMMLSQMNINFGYYYQVYTLLTPHFLKVSPEQCNLSILV